MNYGRMESLFCEALRYIREAISDDEEFCRVLVGLGFNETELDELGVYYQPEWINLL